jgi:hypothetical protein
MKRRNPRFGYQRIAEQIALAFDIEISKDTVRRILAKHYRPDPPALLGSRSSHIPKIACGRSIAFAVSH